jgi:hypothetical protein
MVMNRKNTLNQKSLLMILALVPAVTLLFFGTGCVKKQDKSGSVVAVELVKMNVLYVGVGNPVKISASGFKPSELIVTIDNGTVTGGNGDYIVNVKEEGNATITISCGDTEIRKNQYRVKTVPDPVV